jgi:phosphoribosyl-AMP cyclohydrolase
VTDRTPAEHPAEPIPEAANGWVERLRVDARGLLPAIVQDASSGRVLMLAWMDPEAVRRTVVSRQATYWSRSRQRYWVKGETSGNVQQVREIRLDCDGDTLLLRVDQHGPACHTGAPTCFDDVALLADDDQPLTNDALLSVVDSGDG